jgi:hypothetical protein
MTHAFLPAAIVARAIDHALVLLAEVRAAAQRRHDEDAPELRVVLKDELQEIDDRQERLEVLALLAAEAIDGRIAMDIEDWALVQPGYAAAKGERT